jgi:hypothetical protein
MNTIDAYASGRTSARPILYCPIRACSPFNYSNSLWILSVNNVNLENALYLRPPVPVSKGEPTGTTSTVKIHPTIQKVRVRIGPSRPDTTFPRKWFVPSSCNILKAPTIVPRASQSLPSSSGAYNYSNQLYRFPYDEE